MTCPHCGASKLTEQVVNEYVYPAVAVHSGRKLIASAGTREAIGSMVGRELIVSPITNNTGQVVIGGPSVIAASATREGVALSASAAPLRLRVANLSAVWLDSVVAAEGVTFTYLR